MQRVAGDLGFTKMSLYRYLPGKTELVALIVDRAVGAPPTVDTEDWRAGLTAWSHGLLASFLAHPWAIEATVGPRPIGPHELGWMETAAVVLAGTGLSGSERLDTMAVLTGHVRMIAQQAAASPRPEAQMQTAIGELLRDRADQFPALAAAVSSSVTDEGQDDAFTFGLERILDGLQALIAQRRRFHRNQRATETLLGADRSAAVSLQPEDRRGRRGAPIATVDFRPKLEATPGPSLRVFRPWRCAARDQPPPHLYKGSVRLAEPHDYGVIDGTERLFMFSCAVQIQARVPSVGACSMSSRSRAAWSRIGPLPAGVGILWTAEPVAVLTLLSRPDSATVPARAAASRGDRHLPIASPRCRSERGRDSTADCRRARGSRSHHPSTR